jgi:hypothetical protein
MAAAGTGVGETAPSSCDCCNCCNCCRSASLLLVAAGSVSEIPLRSVETVLVGWLVARVGGSVVFE